jgi:two-component system, sensor histidine kinase and response regulator
MQQPTPPQQPEQATILIVDDGPANLALLGELLQPLYRVRAAPGGRRALAIAATEPQPDLVLLDVMMPEMDGYDVLQHLQADERTRDIPVIFVTALGEAEEERRGLDLGAVDYITKPLRPPVVLARVHSHLELKRARDHLREHAARLEAEMAQRAHAEDEVRRLNARLRDRADELEQSNRDLEAFGYSISHDLRAPLRAINGFASLVLDADGDKLSPDSRHMIGRLLANTATMDRLIDDVLTYSRASRGRMARSDVDLNAIVATTLAEIGPSYPQTRVVADALPLASADAVMMQQVFSNLIGNALKFSAKVAAPQVEIGARRGDDGIEFYVRDNGAGFDMAHASRLFGLFQRLHPATEFPGTGIGLSIVKRLIERHGGRIRAESARGQGATFRFTLGEP